VQRLYDLAELPGAAEITHIAEPWRPHRSLASLYLWTALRALPV
jgi:DNA-3-methyladenine glycosylase II